MHIYEKTCGTYVSLQLLKMSVPSLLVVLTPVFWSVLCYSTNLPTNGSTNADACNDGRFVWNVSIVSQLDLNQFMENMTVCGDQKKAVITNCLYMSLVAGEYELDIIALMKLSINGSLVIKSEGGSVGINCTADNLVGMEDLQPLSRALLVLLDGLIFTGCPVPILIEEASKVVIQNCVFQ